MSVNNEEQREGKTSKDAVSTRRALIRLLEIKDSDIRITTLEQGGSSVDTGIHAGGAFSAVIPLVSLFYGGYANIDFSNPARVGNDIFVLSKGHAIAPLATIYSDLGLIPASVLKNSRSDESILNGHPGPLLPGVLVSTGPLGQGISVATGFAYCGKRNPSFSTFCMVGDGELQEGSVWEAIQYASHEKLDNLCLLIDNNHGQLDYTDHLILPLKNLPRVLESFDWETLTVDATQYAPLLSSLDHVRDRVRDGRPIAIICETRKGFGGLSNTFNRHKIVLDEGILNTEIAQQEQRRTERVEELFRLLKSLKCCPGGDTTVAAIRDRARKMNLEISEDRDSATVKVLSNHARLAKAAPRHKQIHYDEGDLPKLDKTKAYAASSVIADAMRIFARDRRVVSIDSDLSSTSGLGPGIASVDQTRALNVGVAETNMMNMGEAFAALGYNVWVSTFCPFFDWRAMRRIAIGSQERQESIASVDGWLNRGHGLDLTFVATAPNFETATNGATHMGNDDVLVFDAVAHLKIIDVSCPQQLLGVMKWIMEGEKGLVYLRILRAPSAVLYSPDFIFTYGKGYYLRKVNDERLTIVTSGRQVHEALRAAAELEGHNVGVNVLDMPSFDSQTLLELYDRRRPILVVEQNNGYLWKNLTKTLFRSRGHIETRNLRELNTLDANSEARFIHSATYQQLIEKYRMSPRGLVEMIQRNFK